MLCPHSHHKAVLPSPAALNHHCSRSAYAIQSSQLHHTTISQHAAPAARVCTRKRPYQRHQHLSELSSQPSQSSATSSAALNHHCSRSAYAIQSSQLHHATISQRHQQFILAAIHCMSDAVAHAATMHPMWSALLQVDMLNNELHTLCYTLVHLILHRSRDIRRL